MFGALPHLQIYMKVTLQTLGLVSGEQLPMWPDANVGHYLPVGHMLWSVRNRRWRRSRQMLSSLLLTHGLCHSLCMSTWRSPSKCIPQRLCYTPLWLIMKWWPAREQSFCITWHLSLIHFPCSWTSLYWDCISLIKHYPVNPCLRFCLFFIVYCFLLIFRNSW